MSIIIAMLVRAATKDDMPDIYEMVSELASFHKYEPQEILSREQYTKDFEDGCFKAFIAEDDESGHLAGMVICQNTFDCWKGKTMSMHQLYVRPSYRKNGFGKLLWAAVAQAARERGVAYLTWKTGGKNTVALDFYGSVEGVSEVKNDKGLIDFKMSREGIDKFIDKFLY